MSAITMEIAVVIDVEADNRLGHAVEPESKESRGERCEVIDLFDPEPWGEPCEPWEVLGSGAGSDDEELRGEHCEQGDLIDSDGEEPRGEPYLIDSDEEEPQGEHCEPGDLIDSDDEEPRGEHCEPGDLIDSDDEEPCELRGLIDSEVEPRGEHCEPGDLIDSDDEKPRGDPFRQGYLLDSDDQELRGEHCEPGDLIDSDDDEEDWDDSEIYEVERLLQVRTTKYGQKEYLVEWKANYGDAPSWEPEYMLVWGLDEEKEDLNKSLNKSPSRKRERQRQQNGPRKATKRKSRTPNKESSPSSVGQRKKPTLKGAQRSRKGGALQLFPKATMKDSSAFMVPQSKVEKEGDMGNAPQICFASRLFGDRLRRQPQAKIPDATAQCKVDASTFSLLFIKETKTKGFQPWIKSVSSTVYYVATHGPHLDRIDLRHELSKIGDFDSLPSVSKAASRVELFFSDPKKSGKGFMIFERGLMPSMFEEITEEFSDGCGFIPQEMLDRFLVSPITRRKTFAIQVRIFIPVLGIYKGVLHVKQGIDKIQLPCSMKKVDAAKLTDHHRLVCMVIHQTFQSTPSRYLNSIIHGKMPPKTGCEALRRNVLSEMIQSVFFQAGVPSSALRNYNASLQDDKRPLPTIQHAAVVGLCDPTDGNIPLGEVFLTGIQGSQEIGDEIIVSRYPCTNPKDQRILKLCKTKPPGMADCHWQGLVSRSFGGIVFGNPTDNKTPIPATIAAGDLDGDLYFISWHLPFLKAIKRVAGRRQQNENHLYTYPPAEGRPGGEVGRFFSSNMQSALLDRDHQSKYSSLISALHRKWKETVDDKKWEEAFYFGEGFKRSLEIQKHGGQVFLPRNMWNQVDGKLHALLCCKREVSTNNLHYQRVHV